MQHTELLHYQTHIADPDGEWMVFVHGAGGSMRTWYKQVDFFRDKFNLLLVDLRDHGESKDIASPASQFGFHVVAMDVLHVMDSMNIDEAHFVGVSMGSIIIRHIEQIDTARVSSVVLAGGIFRMSRKISLLIFSAKLFTHALPFHILYRIFAFILLPRNNHSASRRVFIREAKKLREKEVKKWLKLLHKLNRTLRDMFNHRIAAPCLVVMGAEDHVFLEPARQYVEKYREVVLEVIEKCGHVCNIEKPQEFNTKCLNFLRQLQEKQTQT